MQARQTQFLKRPAAAAAGEALLIVAHGDRGGERDNRLAREICARMRCTGAFCDVGIAYIRGAPGLAEAADRLQGDTVRVCPLFMSDGYYVRVAIPEGLGVIEGKETPGRRFSIMAPTGLSPRLPAIVADVAAATAGAAGIRAADAGLLIAAHGSSKDPASRRAAQNIADAIRAARRFAAVDTAFLEEPPLLDDQLRTLPGPLLLTGLFIGEGMHGAEDMAAAAAAAGRGDLYPTPPLSRSDALIEAICADITAAAPD